MADKEFLRGPDAGQLNWVSHTLGARTVYRAPDGHISIVEHPIRPKGFGSPVHTHANEDEYSFVIEGEVGVMMGDHVMAARAGDFVAKPRGIAHAFWNAGEAPARILEIITPAGFEEYFAEMSKARPESGPPGREHLARFAEIAAKYSLDIDFGSVGRLASEQGLRME